MSSITFTFYFVLGFACSFIKIDARSLGVDVKTKNNQLLLPLPRICFFFGTRPEVIKIAPILKLLDTPSSEYYGKYQYVTVFTGQHPDLIKPFINYWDIHIDITLHNTFIRNQSVNDLFSLLFLSIHSTIPVYKNDIWLVQGDTTTALAASLVAFQSNIPIVHIEAGLRTFNMNSPFPEEFNRRTISSIAAIHFAPSKLSKHNLLNEGVDPKRIIVSGNTGIDATRLTEQFMEKPTQIQEGMPFVYVTTHRRENFPYLSAIYNAIGANTQCNGVIFFVAVHKNPIAAEIMRTACQLYPNVLKCIAPLSYTESQWMLKHSIFVLTDSGGLQEEATWYNTFVLVVRQNTERPEAIHAGLSRLVNNNTIMLQQMKLICQSRYTNLGSTPSITTKSYPFGDGYTANRILATLQNPTYLKYLYKEMTYFSTSMASGIHSSNDDILCSSNLKPGWNVCSEEGKIDIILTVHKRGVHNLKRQLNNVLHMSILVNRVFVIQHYDIDTQDINALLSIFKSKGGISFTHINLGTNGRYHSRFYIAYMLSTAEYVSIWDDDVYVGKKWISYALDVSKKNNNALIGGNCRSFTEILSPPKISNKYTPLLRQSGNCKQHNSTLIVDFVGHVWLLKRNLLRYYLGEQQFTHATGEDIQLSFALQKKGIISMSPYETDSDLRIRDYKNNMQHASFTNQNLQIRRQLLFLELLQEGFNPQRCRNCLDKEAIKKGIVFFTLLLQSLPKLL